MDNSSSTYLFQFHKGTIETEQISESIEAIRQFQFHKGTIETIVTDDVVK